jgi:hypothetical protein
MTVPITGKRARHREVQYGFLGAGALFFILGFVYSSTVSAIVGLGLIFWSGLLVYITSDTYFRADFVESALLSPVQAVDQLLSATDFKETGIYLPPRYLRALREDLVFIPKKKDEQKIPDVEEIAQGKKLFTNPEGIAITPPGSSLASLYETQMGVDFLRTDVDGALRKISEFLVKRMNIAEKLEYELHDGTVSVVIEGSRTTELTASISKLVSNKSIGGPIESSIAIAITRSTGSPVVIRENSASDDNSSQKIVFEILRGS